MGLTRIRLETWYKAECKNLNARKEESSKDLTMTNKWPNEAMYDLEESQPVYGSHLDGAKPSRASNMLLGLLKKKAFFAWLLNSLYLICVLLSVIVISSYYLLE
jgi:hypothetical protein